MFVTTVPNAGSPPAALFRESYREDGKVRSRTLANLSGWPDEKIQTFRAAPRGGKLFFLPPYSPDTNPIEAAFSELKTLLRQENAGSIEQVEKCIAEIIQLIDRAECLNYFREAGYAST